MPNSQCHCHQFRFPADLLAHVGKNRKGLKSTDEFRLLRHCGRDGSSGGMRQLLEEIVGSQHHRSFSLAWPFEEPTRCSLLNRIAQPHKLIYSLICLHIMLALLSHPTLWSGSTAESRPEESPDRSK